MDYPRYGAPEGDSLRFDESTNDIPSGLFGQQAAQPLQPLQHQPQHQIPPGYTSQQPRPYYQAAQHIHPFAQHQQQQQQQQQQHLLQQQQQQQQARQQQHIYPPYAPAPPVPQQPQQQLPPLKAQRDDSPPPKRPRGRPRKVPGTESRGGPASPVRGRPRGGSRARGRARGRAARGRGKRGRDSSDEQEEITDDSDSDDAAGSVDLGDDLGDDFNTNGENAVAPTTKFGRKVTKPKTFVPTNRPTIQRKKKTSTNPDAHLMCQVCGEGHSQPANKLVICDSCAKGYHQLCAEPNVQEEVVTSDISWYCKACDIKIAQSRPAVDVTTGDWSNSDSYSAEQKREWLENLPLHSLVNYVTSIEKKYAPQLGLSALAIWPPALPTVLADARARREVEAEERRLKEEAEEANAQGTESEAGTPSASGAGPEPPLARTAASVRAAAASATSAAPPEEKVPPPPSQQPAPRQQEHQPRPPAPYQRQNFAPVPVLQPHSQSHPHPHPPPKPQPQLQPHNVPQPAHQQQQQQPSAQQQSAQQQQQQQQQQRHYQQEQSQQQSRSPHLLQEWSSAQHSPFTNASQSFQQANPSSTGYQYHQQHAHSYPNFVNNPSPLYPSHTPQARGSPDTNNDNYGMLWGRGSDGSGAANR